MTIVFFPFLALVVGLGWQFLVRITTGLLAKVSSRRITIHPGLSGLLLISMLSLSILNFNYIGYLSKMSPGAANVIQSSYQMAAAINQTADDNDKLLIMPMIIQPELKTQPDPILFWNLKPDLKVYRVNRLGADYTVVKNIVVNEQINRLLIFPVEGSSQEEIVHRILKDIKPDVLSLPGKTLIIDVDGYWKKSSKNSNPQPK